MVRERKSVVWCVVCVFFIRFGKRDRERERAWKWVRKRDRDRRMMWERRERKEVGPTGKHPSSLPWHWLHPIFSVGPTCPQMGRGTHAFTVTQAVSFFFFPHWLTTTANVFFYLLRSTLFTKFINILINRLRDPTVLALYSVDRGSFPGPTQK